MKAGLLINARTVGIDMMNINQKAVARSKNATVTHSQLNYS
jgi:hypothetical protein